MLLVSRNSRVALHLVTVSAEFLSSHVRKTRQGKRTPDRQPFVALPIRFTTRNETHVSATVY